jgi:hypothetical protein
MSAELQWKMLGTFCVERGRNLIKDGWMGGWVGG